MVIRIAKKEWKEQLREKRFLAAGLLMVLLFGAALISSKAYYEKEQDLRLHAQQGIEENSLWNIPVQTGITAGADRSWCEPLCGNSLFCGGTRQK